MTWQQAVIALWIGWGVIASIHQVFKDRLSSSGVATLGLLIVFAIYIVIVVALHSGGFW